MEKIIKSFCAILRNSKEVIVETHKIRFSANDIRPEFEEMFGATFDGFKSEGDNILRIFYFNEIKEETIEKIKREQSYDGKGLCQYPNNTCPYCLSENSLSRVAETYLRCTKCDHVISDEIIDKFKELKELMNSLWKFWADFLKYQDSKLQENE